MKFEWDPDKNEENLRKHGISLEDATVVFQDDVRLEEFDDRDFGEERWIVIGRLRSILAFVVYTERPGVTRIISARKAEPDEERRYFSQLF
jgi:uncharacterized DUF497 family protein